SRRKITAPEAVASIVHSARALRHLESAFEKYAQTDPAGALAAATAIRSGVELLGDHPLIGRRFRGNLRELVISYGKSGYVALYRPRPQRQRVEVLAIKHQRELGYPW